MSDPAPAPTPTTTFAAWLYDEIKTFSLGFVVGALVLGHAYIPAPSPSPVPSPTPAPAPPIPKPVKHGGALFLSFVEPANATPESSAIREAAVDTDWKALDCRWRAYTEGTAAIAVNGLTPYVSSLPALVVQELPSGVDPDGKSLPPAPVIFTGQPKSMDDVKAIVKQLRGN